MAVSYFNKRWFKSPSNIHLIETLKYFTLNILPKNNHNEVHAITFLCASLSWFGYS